MILDREVYYPAQLGNGWMVFQDDADNESMHLYHFPSGTDIKLNDEKSMNPLVIGSDLFFLVNAPESTKKLGMHLCHVDLKDPELTVEKSENCVGKIMITDGEKLYLSNYITVSPEEWREAKDKNYYVSAIDVPRYIDNEYMVIATLYGQYTNSGIYLRDRETGKNNRIWDITLPKKK